MTDVSQVIIKDPEQAYGHAVGHNVRLPNSEEYIKADPKFAKWYQEDILQGDWPEGPSNISIKL